METAKELNSTPARSTPAIIQFSNGGAQFFAGKGLNNDGQRACIAGGISGAHHVHQLAELYGATVVLHTDHAAKKLLPWIDGLLDAGELYFKAHGKPLFSSHMLDLSEEPLEENIDIWLPERMSKMGMTLEIELGVTGGEEDGVDNSGVDSSKLYTQPEDVALAYERLSKVSPPLHHRRLVRQRAWRLQARQRQAAADHPEELAGIHPEEVRHRPTTGQLRVPRRFRVDARGNPRGDLLRRGQDEHRHRPAMGVLGWRSRLLQEERRLPAGPDRQPEGDDKPNKKYYDPRAWLRKGEESFQGPSEAGLHRPEQHRHAGLISARGSEKAGSF
jgi:fructose-bisphosphate aldolase class II